MLSLLHIENIAVIESADISFDRGFNVLTGETGAGKSIVIDAISAILGERAYRDMIRTGTTKASVRAVFTDVPELEWFTENDVPYDCETIIQREVYLDGVLFSGGQTQRLMLARALYKDGPILMLDEPTAALDPIAENDIYMKYNEMTTGKTSLFISHRLASTRFCDRIIFLADGKIAEEGTHSELLALDGEYAKLYEVQSRYYQEGGESDGE